MIHPNFYQKRNNPSPTWGKLEGVAMPQDETYYQAEKKIEESLKSSFAIDFNLISVFASYIGFGVNKFGGNNG